MAFRPARNAHINSIPILPSLTPCGDEIDGGRDGNACGLLPHEHASHVRRNGGREGGREGPATKNEQRDAPQPPQPPNAWSPSLPRPGLAHACPSSPVAVTLFNLLAMQTFNTAAKLQTACIAVRSQLDFDILVIGLVKLVFVNEIASTYTQIITNPTTSPSSLTDDRVGQI